RELRIRKRAHSHRLARSRTTRIRKLVRSRTTRNRKLARSSCRNRYRSSSSCGKPSTWKAVHRVFGRGCSKSRKRELRNRKPAHIHTPVLRNRKLVRSKRELRNHRPVHNRHHSRTPELRSRRLVRNRSHSRNRSSY
ncbi:MAG: hypothetical protein MI861_12350, partial [Pirellulales bacterium]|nr:hypothetical protein [Pirellulales bacterium]